MSDPRTVDCEVWAKRGAMRLNITSSAELVEIRPKPPYQVLGGIRLPPGDELFWPSPPWHYHFAVISNGLVRDEIYPEGLPFTVYKTKFEHHDTIDFAVRKP